MASYYTSYTFRILGTFANQQLILTLEAPLGSFATTQWR